MPRVKKAPIKKLTPSMLACLKRMKETGRPLYRDYKGIWMTMGTEIKLRRIPYPPAYRPTWSTSAATVWALQKRGLIKRLFINKRWSRDQFVLSGQPVDGL